MHSNRSLISTSTQKENSYTTKKVNRFILFMNSQRLFQRKDHLSGPDGQMSRTFLVLLN